jgi:acyl CoA:acetate/3-ketoacid CoA transferase alpha subunit
MGMLSHWLMRAREAREMAEQMNDSVARAAMITVAENYEIVAKRAEAREAHVSMPNYPKEGA